MLDTLDSFSMITWSGEVARPSMVGSPLTPAAQELATSRAGVPAPPLRGHSVITTNTKQTLAFLCDTEDSFRVSMYRWVGGSHSLH